MPVSLGVARGLTNYKDQGSIKCLHSSEVPEIWVNPTQRQIVLIFFA